jgi:peroxiredoxin
MAVSSSMLELGTELPEFALPDAVSGRMVSSSELSGKASVVMFICNHCPYVKRIQQGLTDFGRYCSERGIPVVAISSNDPVTYPDDAPDKMALEAKMAGYDFPYVFDESQAVAKAFRAVCTPEFYVFDATSKLAYRGRFDDATPKNDVPVTGRDARAAVEALLAGKHPNTDQRPSIGCSIKWKPGNAP